MIPNYPERRGNGLSGRLELRRALKEIAKQKAKKEREMAQKTMTCGRAMGVAHPEKVRSLRALSDRVGRQQLIDWFQQTKYCQGRWSEPHAFARVFFHDVLDEKVRRDGKRVACAEIDREVHKKSVWARVDFVLAEYGNPVAPTRDDPHPDPVAFDDVPSPGTGIVRVVEGIPFTLPTLSRDGAEMARITLTDLAEALGYSDKQRLKELAGRHSREIAEFGVTLTVSVTRKVGVAVRKWEEPTYNPEQAAYLALSSETEQGRACRVRILKAYKALLALFEQAIAAPLAPPAIDYQALASVVATTVSVAMAPLFAQLAGKGRSKVAKVRDQDPAQHPLPFQRSKRSLALEELVKAAARRSVDGTTEFGELVSRKWHELYQAMLPQVDVQFGAAEMGLQERRDITKIEWLERSGNLETSIETALKLWGSR